ncbi:MAG: right-handed parallel beta-helix repeat-containing protein [Planctomycetota bacterium]|nr:right-handed parallel beta-helix repeat-containing protein [Planctomycetota bacterium]
MANPFDFGAAGDGTTDDTDALQHTLDAGDGVLELAKGDYRVSRPLLLDLTRQGYGAVVGVGGTARLIMTGPGPALRILGDHRGTAQPSSVKPHTWRRERMPTVRGIGILGEHPEAVGIELRKTMQTTIAEVLVRQCRIGIHLVERNRNFVLSNSHLYDNHVYGLFFDHCNLHQINVIGNHISYNKRAGIKSLNGDVHNLQITGNDIEYNNRPGQDTPTEGGAEIDFEAPDGVISEVTISGNTIQATIEPGGANVRILGAATNTVRRARLIAITGNVLGSQTRGIDLRNVQRIAITGNTIYDSTEYSLWAQSTSGLSVSGNTIVWRGEDDDPPRDGIWLEDCDCGSLSGLVTQRLCTGTADRGGGITLVRCRDISVNDCQVLDPLIRGIELEDCERCRISNNSIVDRRKIPKMLQGIRVSGSSRLNVLNGNMIGGSVKSRIEASLKSAIVNDNFEV